MAPDDVIEVALRVARAIEQSGGTYFVGGSLASSVDGEPRATNDIDFVLDLPLGRIGDLRSALGPDFEVDEDMLREALLRGSCANAFYLPTVLKIDFFGHAHGPFDDSEFARSRPIEVRPEQKLVIKSPEDSVLRKLLWYRQGGEVSDRQWRDIRGILSNQGERLDVTYLEEWARRIDVAALLERAMRESSVESD